MGQLEQQLDRADQRPKHQIGSGVFSDAYSTLARTTTWDATSLHTIEFDGPTPAPQQTLTPLPPHSTFGFNASDTNEYAKQIDVTTNSGFSYGNGSVYTGTVIKLTLKNGETDTYIWNSADNRFEFADQKGITRDRWLSYGTDTSKPDTYGHIVTHDPTGTGSLRTFDYNTLNGVVLDYQANPNALYQPYPFDKSQTMPSVSEIAFINAQNAATKLDFHNGSVAQISQSLNPQHVLGTADGVGWTLTDSKLILYMGENSAAATLASNYNGEDLSSVGIFVRGSDKPMTVQQYLSLQPPPAPSKIQFKDGPTWYVIDAENSTVTRFDTGSGQETVYTQVYNGILSQNPIPSKYSAKDLPKYPQDYASTATATITPTLTPTPTFTPTDTSTPANGNATSTPTAAVQVNGNDLSPLLPKDVQADSQFYEVSNRPKGVTRELTDGQGNFEYILANGDIVTAKSNGVSAAFDASGAQIGVDAFRLDGTKIAKGNIDVRFTSTNGSGNPAVELQIDQNGNITTTFTDRSSEVDFANGTSMVTDQNGAKHIKVKSKHGRHAIDVVSGQTTIDGSLIDGTVQVMPDGTLNWAEPADHLTNPQTIRLLAGVDAATYDGASPAWEHYTLAGSDFYVSSDNAVLETSNGTGTLSIDGATYQVSQVSALDQSGQLTFSVANGPNGEAGTYTLLSSGKLEFTPSSTAAPVAVTATPSG